MSDQSTMKRTLIDTDKRSITSKAKKERERIQLIEVRPSPEWFVRRKDQWGKPAWYLRLSITGLLPRLYGPFSSQRKCLLFLDWAIDELTDVAAELQDHAGKYMLKRPFQHRGWCLPIIETPELVSNTPPDQHPRNPRKQRQEA